MNDKTKTYTLEYKGCEVINSAEKDGKTIRTWVIFLGGWRTYMSSHKVRIKELIFSPMGFSTGGDTSFQWDEVKKIIITDDNKRIGIFCEDDNKGLLAILPNKEDILCLIKTFCSKEIEIAEAKEP